MTFSIVGRCARTGQLGVAAVTGMAGVGKLLTWAKAGVGAVATQGWINPYLGVDALAMLSNGHGADRALQAVIGLDDDSSMRQVGIVDANGLSANFTGEDSAEVATSAKGEDFTAQGNLLENAETIEACARAFTDSQGEALVERLIRALEAGEETGGDQRGSRSATVLIMATEDYPLWDLRVDDSERPLEDLRRLQDVFADELIPHIESLPTRKDLHGRLKADSQTGLV